MMKNLITIVMLVALVALPAQAQSFETLSLEDQLPMLPFRSTSTMAPVGSAYSSNPMLNADGTAYSPLIAASHAPAAGGPRRIGPSVNSELDETDLVPVGDAVIPLSLLALAFCMVICLRRRTNVSA